MRAKTKSQVEIMVKELEEILSTEGGCIRERDFGICNQLTFEIPCEFAESWELFSGLTYYPIYDPEDEGDCVDQYDHYPDLWVGNQLKLRLKLTKHLLELYKEVLVGFN